MSGAPRTPRPQSMPRLSDADVADIRAMRAQGICYKLIERKYPVHRVTLSRAVNGKVTYAP